MRATKIYTSWEQARTPALEYPLPWYPVAWYPSESGMTYMDSDCRKKMFYEIRIEGYLTPAWSETFDGMQLTLTRCGETLITGEVADQAASHGLLARMRDLNLALISVIRVKDVGQLSNTSATESG